MLKKTDVNCCKYKAISHCTITKIYVKDYTTDSICQRFSMIHEIKIEQSFGGQIDLHNNVKMKI